MPDDFLTTSISCRATYKEIQTETENSKSRAHGIIKYVDTKAKCLHLTKLTCKGTFSAGVYQSLYTGDTLSHVC
jgi:hypothetical protein